MNCFSVITNLYVTVKKLVFNTNSEKCDRSCQRTMEYRNVKGIFFCMLASSHFTWVDGVLCLCALTVQYVYNISASVHFESGLKTCNMRARSLRDELLGRVTVELHAFILHPDSKLIAQHNMLTTKTTVAHEVN